MKLLRENNSIRDVVHDKYVNTYTKNKINSDNGITLNSLRFCRYGVSGPPGQCLADHLLACLDRETLHEYDARVHDVCARSFVQPTIVTLLS